MLCYGDGSHKHFVDGWYDYLSSNIVSGNLQDKSAGLTAKQIETAAKCLSLETSGAKFADYGTVIQRPLDADRFPGLYNDGPQPTLTTEAGNSSYGPGTSEMAS